MRAVTSPELTLLREDYQWSKLFIAILPKRVVYSARLDALPSSYNEVAEISYVSGSGTLANVRSGMTLLIGTTSGSDDLGRARIRKTPTSTIFYIGEESEIIWSASAYLTVIEDFDLWAKHLRIDGSNILMDYDVDYSDQHTSFRPVPVLGSHRVAKLTGSTVDVVLGPDTGEASYVFGSTISAYSWTVPDATLSSSTVAKPTATFNSVGWHACYCTVTAANGKTKTGMRWVYIYDEDSSENEVFEITSLSESVDSGSQCQLTFSADFPQTILKRSLAIIFMENSYGGTTQEVGQVTHAENILYVGRFSNEIITRGSGVGKVTTDLQSYQYWFTQLPVFPIGVEIAKDTPSEWTSLKELTVDRGLWHTLEWRSTATEIMDIFLTDDTRYSPGVSAFASNLWDMMQQFISQQLMGTIGIDWFGRFFAMLEPQLMSNRSGITEVMTLTDDHLQGEVTLEVQNLPQVSLVDLSGISIDQYGGSPQAYFALSPGNVFKHFGSSEIIDRVLLTDQASCNQLASLYLGWKNNVHPRLTVTLLGVNLMISVFPMQYINYDWAADDSIQGFTFSKRFIPRNRSLTYSSTSGVMTIDLELEAETFGENSVQYIPPSGEDISVPPLPPLPTIPGYVPIFPDDVSGQEAPAVVVMIDRVKGIFYTTSFNADNPVYQFWNTGIDSLDLPYLSPVNMQGDVPLFMTPNGAWFVGIREKSQFRMCDTIYYAPSLGARWTRIVDPTVITSLEGAGKLILGLGYNPTKPEEVAFVLGGHFFLGDHTGFTQKVAISTSPQWMGGLTFGGNSWLWDDLRASSEYWIKISADGTVEENSTVSFGQGGLYPTYRAGTSEIIIKSKPGVTGLNGLLRSEDGGITWDVIDVEPEDFGREIRLSYDGLNLFGMWYPGVSGAKRGQSSDGGYTWSGSFFTFGDFYTYAYCGGSGPLSRWILARGSVRFSQDFGLTWAAKEGNLPYVIPGGTLIIKIVVPGYLNQ